MAGVRGGTYYAPGRNIRARGRRGRASRRAVATGFDRRTRARRRAQRRVIGQPQLG